VTGSGPGTDFVAGGDLDIEAKAIGQIELKLTRVFVHFSGEVVAGDGGGLSLIYVEVLAVDGLDASVVGKPVGAFKNFVAGSGQGFGGVDLCLGDPGGKEDCAGETARATFNADSFRR